MFEVRLCAWKANAISLLKSCKHEATMTSPGKKRSSRSPGGKPPAQPKKRPKAKGSLTRFFIPPDPTDDELEEIAEKIRQLAGESRRG
jgi:hypothetical protein